MTFFSNFLKNFARNKKPLTQASGGNKNRKSGAHTLGNLIINESFIIIPLIFAVIGRLVNSL